MCLADPLSLRTFQGEEQVYLYRKGAPTPTVSAIGARPKEMSPIGRLV